MDIVRPSFLGFMLNGLLLGIGFIIFVLNYKKIGIKNMIIILLVMSIAVGIHSMLHYREEKDYGFNPIKKFFS
jgi:uncharacterized membrane protein